MVSASTARQRVTILITFSTTVYQNSIWYRPKVIWSSNTAQSHPSITSISVAQSFWNYAQHTIVSLEFFLHNHGSVDELWMLWVQKRVGDVWDNNEFRKDTLYCADPFNVSKQERLLRRNGNNNIIRGHAQWMQIDRTRKCSVNPRMAPW